MAVTEHNFGGRFIFALMPRFIILLGSIGVSNIIISVLQMCNSQYTIPGTCINPQYMPLPYISMMFGLVAGGWFIFLYSIWDHPDSEEDSYE